MPDDAIFPGGGGESIDDGLRIIGGGEHATVGFDFEFHSLFLEPRNGVGWLEAVECPDEVFDPARIVFDKLSWIVAIVGDVASPAAGDPDLGENFRTAFQNEDVLGSGFGC